MYMCRNLDETTYQSEWGNESLQYLSDLWKCSVSHNVTLCHANGGCYCEVLAGFFSCRSYQHDLHDEAVPLVDYHMKTGGSLWSSVLDEVLLHWSTGISPSRECPRLFQGTRNRLFLRPQALWTDNFHSCKKMFAGLLPYWPAGALTKMLPSDSQKGCWSSQAVNTRETVWGLSRIFGSIFLVSNRLVSHGQVHYTSHFIL